MTTTLNVPTTFMGYKANNDRNLTSVRDLLAEHGLDYNVGKVQATYDWDGETREAENQFNLVRLDTGECLSNATVTKTYQILEPGHIADDFQFFVDGGYATPFSAFRTGNGVECVALMLNPDLFKGINGYTGFILGQNRQGNKAATGSLFVYRQVCSNGMMGWAKSGSFSISHRGNVRQKFTDHTREWARIERAFQEMNERMTELSGVPMTFEQLTQATDTLVGTQTVDGVVLGPDGEPANTRRLNIRDEILAATNMPQMGTHGSTAADFYHAVTYRLSHAREGSRKSVTAMTDSLITGASRTQERKALAILDNFTDTGLVTV